MENKILRKLFLAFMRIHILHHAKKEPFFGLWMMEELRSHGYEISSGTIYPILHNMEEDGILETQEKVIEGKVRKYYLITDKGEKILKEAEEKTKELFEEIISWKFLSDLFYLPYLMSWYLFGTLVSNKVLTNKT